MQKSEMYCSALVTNLEAEMLNLIKIDSVPDVQGL